jgi:RimJ/RimL family protein N-acetyltransferase
MPEAITFVRCEPTEDDARQVMEWRNDPTSLAMFFHRTPKRWDTFWPEFRDEYFATEPPPLFVVTDGERSGFLRFKPVPHPLGLPGQCVDISINIAPSARGRGIGRRALEALPPELARAEVSHVLAVVRRENEASRRAFESAGYAFVDETTVLVEDTGEQVAVVRYVQDVGSSLRTT